MANRSERRGKFRVAALIFLFISNHINLLFHYRTTKPLMFPGSCVPSVVKIFQRVQNQARNFKIDCKWLPQLAEQCFNLLMKLCFHFGFVLFTKAPSGKYVMLSSWRHRLRHYCVLGAICTLITHQFTVCLERLVLHELDVLTSFYISFLLLHFAPLCVAVGIIWKPLETTHVLNSWPEILSCLKMAYGGRSDDYSNDKSKYSSFSFCLKIIAPTAFVAFVTFSAAVWSIIFSDLPIFIAPLLAKTFRVTPGEKLLPDTLWPLLFFPVELMAAGLPLAAAGLNVCVVLISLETFRIYLNELE